MPTEQDLAILQTVSSTIANESTFVKMMQTDPPKVVFDDPRITDKPRVIAAYWPEENLMSFKSGRVDQEAVRHEYYHAGQRFYLGVDFCSSHNCETAAYEFEKFHPRVQYRVTYEFNAFRDWGGYG